MSSYGAVRIMKLMVAVVGLCVLGVLTTGNAYGQAANSGSIIGFVSDQSGAVVPGATVTITEVSRGVAFSGVTDDTGFYRLIAIPPGTYNFKLEKGGFKAYLRENILVDVDRAVRVDAQLEVGRNVEQVQVTGASPVLQTEQADVSGVVGSQFIQDMPIIGRNFAYLDLLMPGAVGYLTPEYHPNPENPEEAYTYYSNGVHNGAAGVTVDGVDDHEQVLGQTVLNPDLDEIAEVKITTADFSAEYGRVGSSLTQIETKSGTNSFHGSAYEFDRNNAANARNPFTEPTKASPFKWNQFGFTVGGPIKKDRTFFFGGYQGKIQHDGTPERATVPLEAWRGGDFSNYVDQSGSLIPIYDPSTGDINGNGRTQFPDNVIPTSRFSSQGKALLALLPPPTFPNTYVNNYIAPGREVFNTYQPDVRIDHYFGQSTRLFGHYDYFSDNITSPSLYGTGGGGPVGGGTGEVAYGRNQNISVNLTHSFRSNLLLYARFGYNRYRIFDGTPEAPATVSGVGIPGANPAGLPSISVGSTLSAQSFNMGSSAGLNEQEQYSGGEGDMTWIKGRHTIKYGVDMRRWNNLRDYPGNMRGSFSFPQQITGSASVAESGSGVASLLLGDANGFSSTFALVGSGVGWEHETQGALFVQDQWKVTPKLTLSYGLRYEIMTPYATGKEKGAGFDFTTGNIIITGLGSISSTANVTTPRNDYGPRLGLAYLVTPKTVIRAGLGRSFWLNFYDDVITGQWPAYGGYSVASLTPYQTVLTLGQGFPAPVKPVIPSNGVMPLPQGFGFTAQPPNRKDSTEDSANFTVQRQLTPTLSFNVGYVGTFARHTYWNWPWNPATPGPGPQSENRPKCATLGICWGGITVRDSNGSSNYNSFQAQVIKRVGHGLTFTANYTWSKSIDFGWFDNDADYASDANNWRVDRGPSARDRTNTLTLGHVYELPFGANQRFLSSASGVVNGIVGGWKFSGMTNLISGPPFDVQTLSTASVNSSDWHYLRPDIIGDPHVSNPNRNLWYNPAAFAQPGPYREGTFGRNVLRAPGYASASWALYKDFRLTEKAKLQFRAEAYNLFNKTNLGSPDGTFQDPTAGVITSIQDIMREMQFGLRLDF